MASAVAGLLWRDAGGQVEPLPWADPLAGAELRLLVEAWRRGGSPSGVRVRVSPGAAAARAAVPVAPRDLGGEPHSARW